MTKLTCFVGEYDGAPIRTTEDRQFSVYDVLVAFGVSDKQHAQTVFSRIANKHSEVDHFCVNFKFPGRGQRETPVATEENIYQILMLCPGKKGAEFRAWAARLVRERREEEADGDVAYQRGRDRAVRVWRRQGMDDETIKARLKGIEKRNIYTDTLKAHGVVGKGYAICTNAIYTSLFDQSAAEIREERGLAKKDKTRDHLDEIELATVDFAETLAAHKIKKRKAQGVDQCETYTRESASTVRRVMDEDGALD